MFGLLSPFLSQEFAEICCCDAVLKGTSYSKCLTSCMAALFYSLQTVCVLSVIFFTIFLSRDRKTKMLPDVGLIRRRGIFNFSFPRIHVALLMFSSSDFCNCDESTRDAVAERVGHIGSSTNRIRLSSYRKSIATTLRCIL